MEQFYTESEHLLQFIAQSPTCFHVIKNVEEQLTQNGFLSLKEHQSWQLERGKSYYS